MARPKIGIALGGGAARGWAHLGVLRSLREAGIEPDIIAGTSIGAVAGACYVTDRLPELHEFATSLTRRRVFGFVDLNFGGSGLITGQRLSSRLEAHLNDYSIEDLPRKFVAVATELGTGHEVWLSKGSLVDALKASYALPGIFRPIQIDGRWLIDGALVNPIPVSVCRALGARLVIAVNLSSDLFSRGGVIPDQNAIAEQPDPTDAAAPGGNGRSAVRLLQRQLFGKRDAPGISSVMMDAINITQDRISRSRLAGDPPDITINPRVGNIGLFDFHRAEEAITAGAEATARHLSDIRNSISMMAV
ncbi:patatin-like phospholipase family protein [Methyloligella sp. 2.7D]|uniref:patatin-like phospholipase family protein n=1 Tax=unclassified Methyloligella TaxID=2625955 RepID=UPI00157DAA74|nr:patatin-like phospholipase family protein [Methyloligella sp. GL2]QKP77307.1 patatin-like phospholipase family protein [Methyloligella sp. GL2]